MTFTHNDPPRVYSFRAHAGPDTTFDLTVFGRLTPKICANIARHMEMVASFLENDAAPDGAEGVHEQVPQPIRDEPSPSLSPSPEEREGVEQSQ